MFGKAIWLAASLAGGVLGGILGYFAFFWIGQPGFLALAVPAALVGAGCGLCSRRDSALRGVLCGISGIGLTLYAEWRRAPFVADESFGFFITHFYNLKPIKLLVLALGGLVAYWLGHGSA